MKKFLNIVIAVQILLISMSLLYIASEKGFLNKVGEQALAFSSQSGVKTFEIQKTKPQTPVSASQPTQAPQTTSQQVAVQSQPVAVSAPAQKPQPANPADAIDLSYSHIVIPSVGIDEPITWDVNGRDMNKYLPVISHNIAHYDWTALPGEGGSTTLFGHSSYTQNLPNNYDEVFAPLFDMKNGDKVYVVYKNKLYTYEMYATQTIVPTNPEFISQNGPERVMLMTCAPLGSQKYRLLVYAKRIQ